MLQGRIAASRGRGGSTLISQLAVGQTLTEHDVPLLGDFTYYLSTVVNTPLSNGDEPDFVFSPVRAQSVG